MLPRSFGFHRMLLWTWEVIHLTQILLQSSQQGNKSKKQLAGNSWFARTNSFSVTHCQMEGRGWGVTKKRITEMKESGKAAKSPPSLPGGTLPWGNGKALVAPLKLFSSLADLPRWSKGSSHTNKAAAHPGEQHTLAAAVCPRQGHGWAQKHTDSKETETKLNIQEKEWQVKQILWDPVPDWNRKFQDF